MSEANLTNSTVVRLFELYRKIPSYRGAGISTKQLHQLLLEEGFNVSKRTVERDLIKLQEITGIYSERMTDGNVWKNTASNLDLVPTMQPTEALLLVAAERYLRHALPPQSESLLESRLEKAHKTLGGSGPLGKWQNKLYIIEGQMPHQNQGIDFGLSSTIYQAVLSETQLTLSYQKLDSNEPSDYLSVISHLNND